jgi:hypothetical protein
VGKCVYEQTNQKKQVERRTLILLAESKTTKEKNYDRLTHAYVHWLAEVHSGSFAPAFTLSFHDSECSRKPPMPIASVVRRHYKKKKKMTRNLTIFLLLVLVGCTSRPTQTIENSTVKPDTASNKNEIKKKAERLFDFYYSFAYEKKFQLERTKFPLTVENYDKVYQTNKDDWKQDSLFTKLEYITFILSLIHISEPTRPY